MLKIAILKYLLLSLSLLIFSACSSYHSNHTFTIPSLEKKDLFNTQKDYKHETSWAEKKDRPTLGIALSGGGSKAAPFAMGVLKRFIDEKWLKEVDIISSVSGGSYSAYYLYNKAIQESNNKKFGLGKYFENCEIDKLDKIKELTNNNYTDYKSIECINYGNYQRHVKENQDLLAFIQNKSATAEKGFKGILDDIQASSSVLGSLILTLPTIPFHNISNTLFDWKIEMSPSQYIYKNGIINAFGDTKYKKRENDTFENLKSVIESKKLPMWIINTSNFKSNWWKDTFKKNSQNLDETIFEITPYGFGSQKHNYSEDSPDKLSLDLPRATLASAAFFDALWDAPLQELAFGGLHLINLRWGIKIPQYNVTTNRQKLHNLLPWPFYYFDMKSSKITLADGGHSGDNLGLYSLIKRGTKNIVIVSGSNDVASRKEHTLELKDICSVGKFLKEKNYKIFFKGRENNLDDKNKIDFFVQFCKKDKNSFEKTSYYEWKKPVWEGWIEDKNSIKISNLYFIKAAVDKKDLIYNSNAFNKNICNESNCSGYCNNKNICQYTKKYGYYPKSLLHFWLKNSKGEETTFPQTSTVFNTINSSSSLYQAYMDLGYFLSGHLRNIEYFKKLHNEN